MHDIFQRQYVSFLKTHQFAIPTIITNKGNTNVLHRIQAKFKKLHAPKRVPTATLIVNYDHKKPIKRQLYRSKTAKKIVTGNVDKCQLLNFLSPKMSLKDPLVGIGNYFNSKSDRSINKITNADINKEDTSIKKESFNMSKSMKELDNSNQQESSKNNLYASCSPRCHISLALKKEIKHTSNLLSRHLHLYTSCPKSLRTISNDNEADKNSLTENIRIQGIKKVSPTQLKKQHIKCNSDNISKNRNAIPTSSLHPPAIVITSEKNKATQSFPTKQFVNNDRNPNSKKLNGLLIQRQKKKIVKLKNEKKVVKLESAGVRAISKIDIRRKCSQVK
jgi:hypothetical protein